MSQVLITEGSLQDIADAIRGKLGVDTTYKPGQMAAAIGQIDTQAALTTLNATANGSFTPPQGFDGFSAVTVNVSGGGTVGVKSITENGTYDARDDGLDGYSSVTVNVSGGGGGPAVPSLPAGYQAVEYVSFDGASYFTCAFPQWGMITVDYEQTALATGSLVFGYRGNSTTERDLNLGSTGTEQRWYVRNSVYLGDTTLEDKGNNRFLAQAFGGAGHTSVYIGRYWGSSSGYPFNGKLYAFSVLKPATNAYALYLVPCYRIADGVIGFCDAVGGVFYTNEGTGAFGKGPDVT